MHWNIARWANHIGAIGLIAALAGAIAFGVSVKSTRDRDDALQAYRSKAHDETELTAKAVAGAFDQMYQNLRTISLLASVRRIDRHGDTLSADGRQSIQQLYNNLASNIAVSEVYIVPAELDPDAIDPKTGEKQVPILMFDTVRLGLTAGTEEAPRDPNLPVQEESYEYHALRDLMAKLRQVAPKLAATTGSDIPFFTLPSLITCDNSVYDKTRKDADRTGPIYSVPFYGEDNILKGTISAIMLDSAVQSLLPSKNYALLDRTNGTVFPSLEGGQQRMSAAKVAAQQPDSDLFYSEVIPVGTKDPDPPFKLWAGRPRAEFLTSATIQEIDHLATLGYILALGVAIAGLALWLMIHRSFVKAEATEALLQRRLEQRSQEIHALTADQERGRAAAERDRRRIEGERAAETAALAAEQAEVVAAIATGLDRLAGGELRFRFGNPFPVSYEKLRQDFNQAMNRLESIITAVADSTRTIRGGSGEIHAAASDLAQRTARQAAGLEETAAALVEVTATIKQTAEGATKARTMVMEAKAEAEQSEGVVKGAGAAMQGIESSSRRIGQIIGVIDEIAFQTNLLALNAGVEAAQAGDAGRGFAVVASEVRALAQRSAEAAREIKALIAASKAEVDKGVDLVGKTGRALERIIGRVGEINAFVVAIAASAEQQAIGLDGINGSTAEMDRFTQQNAAMVEQSSAASQTLAQEAEALARQIGHFATGRGAMTADTKAPAPRRARAA